jgi:hypothetical protein
MFLRDTNTNTNTNNSTSHVIAHITNHKGFRHSLRAFETRVLRGVFRPRREKTLRRRSCTVRVIKLKMRVGTCGTYWGKDKCLQDFDEEILKVKDLDVRGG